MCGISAFISAKISPGDQEVIQRMTEIVSHRGPDGFGYFQSEKVLLGHRRLAIVDLTEDGKQPMEYLERYVITYNGEIYNHIEIREELVQEGYVFKSHSDTEVILAAYDFWGKGCLDKFNGMWGFLIYDRIENQVFAARDRYGVKPLYYYWTPSGDVLFGSEIKQFTAHPDWTPVVNAARAYDFLHWGLLDHTDETLFKGVFQVPHGSYAMIDLNHLKESFSFGRIPSIKWYDLTKTKNVKIDFKNAVQKFRELFYSAVKFRLRADVEIGSCLSGGLDSSSIVCVVNDILQSKDVHHQQSIFSACSTEKRFDEKQHIDTVVNKTGVKAHYTYPSLSSLNSSLDQVTWHQDEPFGSTSIFAQWEVFKLAAQSGVKVMLDGQGADEQLAGYHGYFSAFHTELFVNFRWIKLWSEIKSASRVHGYRKIFLFKRTLVNLIPVAVVDILKKAFRKNSSELFDFSVFGHPEPKYQRIFVPKTSIAKYTRSQLTESNLQMLLHWEDRDSMAHSIESRVPFVDYRVIEFSYSLPSDFKIKDGVTKAVLREAMNGVLPKSIKSRQDKLGFVTPEEIWAKGEGADSFRAAIVEAVEISQGLIKPKIISNFDQFLMGRSPYDFMYWRVISFGVWMRIFNVKIVSETA